MQAYSQSGCLVTDMGRAHVHAREHGESQVMVKEGVGRSKRVLESLRKRRTVHVT